MQHVEISVQTGEWIIRPELLIGNPDSETSGDIYRITFAEPIRIQPDTTYTVSALIKGPPTKFTKYSVTTFDGNNGLVFSFNSSNESGNGTSSARGQFPELFYKYN